MKFILLFLAIPAAALLWLSCKHTKYTAEKLPEKQIRWGNGGGFAGKESAHILCDNGQIFKRDIKGNATEAGKTKGQNAKSLFKTAEGLTKKEFLHPGNIYYFIEFKDGDMLSRVVWGDRGHPAEKALSELFDRLNGLLKK